MKYLLSVVSCVVFLSCACSSKIKKTDERQPICKRITFARIVAGQQNIVRPHWHIGPLDAIKQEGNNIILGFRGIKETVSIPLVDAIVQNEPCL